MARFLSATLVVALASMLSFAADSTLKGTVSGEPKLQGIDVIAFGPEGTLLIGDGKGAQLIAVDTKDTTKKAWKAEALAKIDDKIAAKLGTTAKNIEITHLTVNPASGTAYIAVRKQDESKTLIVTVDGDGKIGEFALDKVNYVAVPLPKNDKAKISKITDVAWAKGRVLVGALSNEEFPARVYSIPTPLDASKKGMGFGTETYHVAHGRWETKAPMQTLIPLERNGKQFVVGAFQCTPIVRYPLDDVKQDGKVKGSSVIELGNGNRPVGMFSYSKDKKDYLLVNNFRSGKFGAKFGPSNYWVARVDMDFFDEQEKVNQKAQWRIAKNDRKEYKPITDKVKMIDGLAGTVLMDRLNDTHAVVIIEDLKGGRTLKAMELP